MAITDKASASCLVSKAEAIYRGGSKNKLYLGTKINESRNGIESQSNQTISLTKVEFTENTILSKHIIPV